MKITIQPDGPRFRLFVDDGRMRAMPCGERLFRAPPIPDIKFVHALLPDAERDAALLRTYIAREQGAKSAKKENTSADAFSP